MYLEIELPPVLSREEEIELGKKLKSKNKKIVREARLKFVEHNLRLVSRIAHDYLRFGGSLEYQDLVNEGNIGLIKAAEKYDVDRGVKFSTYSSFWIKQNIRRALGNDSRMVRVPCELQRVTQKIKLYIEEFEETFNHSPSVKTVKKKFGVSEAIAFHAFNYMDTTKSFNQHIGRNDETKTTLQDVFLDENSVSPSDTTEINDNLSDLLKHMNGCLTNRENKIVRMRFGMETGEPLTLEKVSDHIGVTRERIRQIVDASLVKLQKSYSKAKYVESH